jgi:ATP-binding cassette subfamily B multidrug efflux pump
VLVTHRVAAASRCDKIIVLDEGRVIDQGTHDELVRNGGLYAAFNLEQSAKTELDAIEIDEVAS